VTVSRAPITALMIPARKYLGINSRSSSSVAGSASESFRMQGLPADKQPPQDATRAGVVH